MSQLDRVDTHFSAGSESLELEGYRPISPLVVLACVAGLASLLAIVHPLLWIVPLVAFVLSACAIRQVSAAHSRYSGRLAAVAALCLATLIGTYAPARAISRQRTLYARAQSQLRDWITLVQQGRYQEAHQFTLPLHDRFQGPGQLSKHYLPPVLNDGVDAATKDPALMDADAMHMEPSGSDQLTAFLQDPVIAKIVEFGEQGTVEHVQDISISTELGNVEVTQQFRVSGVHDGQPESSEFLVTSTRWEALGRANWQFAHFQIAN